MITDSHSFVERPPFACDAELVWLCATTFAKTPACRNPDLLPRVPAVEKAISSSPPMSEYDAKPLSP